MAAEAKRGPHSHRTLLQPFLARSSSKNNGSEESSSIDSIPIGNFSEATSLEQASKATKVLEKARKNQHPLQIKLEKE